jgi:hypothetical protein
VVIRARLARLATTTQIDLDRPFDIASPVHQDIDVDDVNERASADGCHAAQRRQCPADVEEVVDRLA